MSATTALDLGFASGVIVQEFGYDEDVDFDLRDSIEDAIGSQMEDEDYTGVADSVLAWWRSEDGDTDDLTDYLVDCAASLEGASIIWLAIPARGVSGHVNATDVDEAARSAGMNVTSPLGLESEWMLYRISARGK
ncbi:hypothetical protein J2S49_000281 [Arcanobacterium wilhelmae]|uniref:DUF3052 domain-containing protein n=1 Tax=Arcanobacterium wilhelmae TaxID=1803177 RepID=A0ABT9N9L4_9ACTO|nr:DUF3052 domain-containing protein [Arcanobacterium wilhelmae]MDP9800205.1 hypothetical protein [Arcanobacterium wilhelmae]WFN89646.1 DUF3052 domain-containing protein [Arcanobacterium wilhelmae]